MKKINPYEVLGVDRDASEDEIREAAKKRAKETHPDAGGDSDEFNATRRALAILTDKKKRKKFDQTGSVDDAAPDNSGGHAIQLIHVELASIVNAYLMSGFRPDLDPRRMDLIKVIGEKITVRIRSSESALNDGRTHAGFLKDLVGRLKMKKSGQFDFISRQVNDQIAEVESKLGEVEQAIVDAKLALTLLKSFDFKSDPPDPAQGTYYAGMTTGGVYR